MGFASSSAVRRDDAYGSLGGSFGGTERKLKKKPVLVLDPEELAKAHHLFQIGAAEQLGEFDPRNRVSLPAAAVFGMVIGGGLGAGVGAGRFDDEEDDYVAPVDLADEDEEPEDELPPIDLDALLALTRAEQEEEDQFQRDQAEAALAFEPEEEPDAAEPEAIEPEADEPVSVVEEAEATQISPAEVPAVPTADASTADALARILGRAAARPQAAPLLADLDLSDLAPTHVEADEPVQQAEPDLRETVREEPIAVAEFLAEEPQWPSPEVAAEPEEVATFADTPWPNFEDPEAGFEPLELPLQDSLDGDAFMRPDAPLRVAPIMGEEGVRSSLRARLVREEIMLDQPEPTAWRKLAEAWRRMWQRFS